MSNRPRQKVTRAGIKLIAAFEGLRRRAARLPDGRWTIGYGHTLSAREGAEVSQEDAEALLHFDLLPIAEAVNSLVYTPLTQNQFDALVAFAYNVGIDTFRGSEVLKRVNEGRLTEAACALDLWRKADLTGEPIILDALIRRRAAEKALFLTPADGYVPTPSPLVRPQVDTDLAPALPQSRPHEIVVPMDGALAEIHHVAQPRDPEPEPVTEARPEAPAADTDFSVVAPAASTEAEGVEITASDAEPADTLPQPSEPVEATYTDAPLAPVAEIPAAIEVETVSAPAPERSADAPAFEPATEALGPVADQPIGGVVSPEPVVEVLSPEPQPVAEIPTHDTTPIEGEAVEVFPYARPVEALEPAADLGEPAPFPTEPVVPAHEPEPAPDAPSVQQQPETVVPLAAPPPQRIYAPEPAAQPEAAPQPVPFEPPSGWSLTPPPEVIEPAPSRQDTRPPAPPVEDTDPALFDPDAMDQDVGGRIIRYEELQQDEEDPADRSPTGTFILMGAIGLTAIGGSIAALLKDQNDISGNHDLLVAAWVLAFIGAGCAGTAVYFLLKRLGGVKD